jgi:type IV pilus assembly protein PilC
VTVQYRYTGRSADGELLSGTVWGEDEPNALRSISNRGISIISFTLLEKKRKKVWGNLEISYFFEQVHMLLKSGYTIVHAIQLLTKKNKNKKMKVILQQIYNDLVDGQTFHYALKRVEMKEMVLQWIYIAENSGDLEGPCLEISKYFKSKQELIQKLTKVLSYPLFMLVVSIALFVFCSVVFIPKFFPLYEGFGIEPPLFVIVLASIGVFLQIYGMYMIAFLLIGFVTIYLLRARLQVVTMLVLDKIPLFMKMKQVKVFLLLSIMINSGIGLYDAIRIMKNGASNTEEQRRFSDWMDEIKQGTNLSTLLESSSFDDMYIHMIKIGESSGNLGEMLGKCALHADEIVKESIERTIAVIQPLLIMILGIIVGIMIYTIMLPVSSVLKSV